MPRDRIQGKEDLGKGSSRRKIQTVAEELAVPVEHVTLIYCDTSMTPDQGVTSGSQSHPRNFNHEKSAQAGATAREALLQMASQTLECFGKIKLTAWDGVITSKNDTSRKSPTANLVGGKKFARRRPTMNAKRKRAQRNGRM